MSEDAGIELVQYLVALHSTHLMLDAVEHAAEGLVAGVAGQHSRQHVGLLVVRDGLP